MEGLREMAPDQVAWAIAGAVLSLVVFVVVWRAIGGILFGIFLYYALRPLYRRIYARTHSRGASAFLTLVAFGIPLVLVLGYAGLLAYQEVTSLLGREGVSGLVSALRPFVDVSELSEPGRLAELVGAHGDALAASAGMIFEWGIRLLVTVVVAFYLLRDDERIGDWLRETFGGNDEVVAFVEAVDVELQTIFTGSLVTVIVNGLVAAVTFSAFNWVTGLTVVTYPVVLGLLIGAFTLVPAVGIAAVYYPYTGLLFARAFVWQTLPVWVPFAFFAVTFVVVELLPDFFVRAYVSGRHYNTGLMMLAFVLGTVAFGWYGIFLGPILLVLFLEFYRRIFPRIVRGWSRSTPVESD